MYDKVSVGAKSIVMQNSIVSGPKAQEEGAKVSEGASPVKESQVSDSIM